LLCRRQIDLENSDPLPVTIPVGKGIETRTEDHKLTQTVSIRPCPFVFDHPAADHYRCTQTPIEGIIIMLRVIAKGFFLSFSENFQGQRIFENKGGIQELMDRTQLSYS
jgi:hypothetical protein